MPRTQRSTLYLRGCVLRIRYGDGVHPLKTSVRHPHGNSLPSATLSLVRMVLKAGAYIIYTIHIIIHQYTRHRPGCHTAQRAHARCSVPLLDCQSARQGIHMQNQPPATGQTMKRHSVRCENQRMKSNVRTHHPILFCVCVCVCRLCVATLCHGLCVCENRRGRKKSMRYEAGAGWVV